MLLFISLLVTSPAGAATPAGIDQTGGRCWKGNLHTDTFRSDGDHFPEMVAQWYKDRGCVNNEGDELYVRAKVISSPKNEKSYVPDGYEYDWVQPVVMKLRRGVEPC